MVIMGVFGDIYGCLQSVLNGSICATVIEM